jgi:hypothetical protein
MRLSLFLCVLFALVGISAAQDTNFSVGPQYLMNFGSPMFAQPIATPSLSWEAPLPPLPSLPQIGPTVTDQSFVTDPELRHQANLFPIYYGYPMISVVELTGSEPRELPASITDTGVTGVTNSSWLRENGYGVPLGDTASYWKMHKPHAPRVFTNEDVQRTHQ